MMCLFRGRKGLKHTKQRNILRGSSRSLHGNQRELRWGSEWRNNTKKNMTKGHDKNIFLIIELQAEGKYTLKGGGNVKNSDNCFNHCTCFIVSNTGLGYYNCIALCSERA